MTKKNIQSLSPFDVMEDSMLAAVEGGIGADEVVCTNRCMHLLCAVAGAVVPVVGTGAGAILGAQYCTGIWLIIRH